MRYANRAATARALIAALLLCSSLPATVLAGDHEDVQQLLDRGQPSQALSKVQSALSARPGDARLQLLKGVVLVELGRRSEAIAVFNQLAQQYPYLPEPFNNLAAVHARNGEFEKALDALNRAIRSNPSYAVAHENLGDLYAALASQAYKKSLQIEGDPGTANPKLALINDLFAAKAATPAQDAVAIAKPPPTPMTPAAPQQPAARSGPLPAVVAQAPAAPAAAAPAKGNAETAAVEAAVRAWAAAWAAKDVPGYLASYGAGFKTPSNMDRQTWESERKKRIEGKSKIEVNVTDLQISLRGDEATARFRQAYSADTIKVTSRKTLVLKRVDERWSIIGESTGS